MRNIFLVLFTCLISSSAFAQLFMQFSQTEQYLNPALAGSTEKTRLTTAATLLENTNDNAPGSSRKDQAIYGLVALDGYSKKLKSGWGIFYHSERFNSTYTGELANRYDKYRINTNELAFQFAPKFTRVKKKKPDNPITWSPGLELRFGYTSTKQDDPTFHVTNNGFSGAAKIGISRKSEKSLLGFGYMLGYLSHNLLSNYNNNVYHSAVINPSLVQDLFIHYGYNFYFDDNKDYGVTPMVFVTNRIKTNQSDRYMYEYFRFRNSGIMLSGNFKFKKILAGTGYVLNNYINDGGVITFFSLGYQTKSVKVTGTYNIYTGYDRVAELTMNYLF